MTWINFRASHDDGTVYWTTSEAPVNGDDRLNIEVPPESVSSTGALERLLAQATQVDLCTGCTGATVSLGAPFQGVGFHAPECFIYYGWTTRDMPWTPRTLTPEPTP